MRCSIVPLLSRHRALINASPHHCTIHFLLHMLLWFIYHQSSILLICVKCIVLLIIHFIHNTCWISFKEKTSRTESLKNTLTLYNVWNILPPGMTDLLFMIISNRKHSKHFWKYNNNTQGKLTFEEQKKKIPYSIINVTVLNEK